MGPTEEEGARAGTVGVIESAVPFVEVSVRCGLDLFCHRVPVDNEARARTNANEEGTFDTVVQFEGMIDRVESASPDAEVVDGIFGAVPREGGGLLESRMEGGIVDLRYVLCCEAPFVLVVAGVEEHASDHVGNGLVGAFNLAVKVRSIATSVMDRDAAFEPKIGEGGRSGKRAIGITSDEAKVFVGTTEAFVDEVADVKRRAFARGRKNPEFSAASINDGKARGETSDGKDVPKHKVHVKLFTRLEVRSVRSVTFRAFPSFAEETDGTSVLKGWERTREASKVLSLGHLVELAWTDVTESLVNQFDW